MTSGLKSTARRAALLAFAAALVPACHDGGGGGGGAAILPWSLATATNLSIKAPFNALYDNDVDDMIPTDLRDDSSGNLHVIWFESVDSGNTVLWYSTNRGGPWSTPLPVRFFDGGPGPNSNIRDLRGASDGSAYVAYIAAPTNSGVDTVYLQKIFNGSLQGGAINICNGVTVPNAADAAALQAPVDVGLGAVSVRIRLSSDNIAHVTWVQGDSNGLLQVWHRAFNGTTGALSDIRRVSDASVLDAFNGNGDYEDVQDYRVRLDGSNNLHFTFTAFVDDDSDDQDASGGIDLPDTSTDRETLYYKFKAAGLAGALDVAATDVLPLSAPSTPHYAPSVTETIFEQVQLDDMKVDDAGRIHVIAAVDRGEGGSADDVFYNRRAAGAGGAWVGLDPVTLSLDSPGGNVDLLTDSSFNELISLTVNDQNGDAFVTWIDYDPVSPTRWYLKNKRRTLAGATFAAQTSTLVDSDYSDGGSDMFEMATTVVDAGNLAIVYERESVSNLGFGGFSGFGSGGTLTQVCTAYVTPGVAPTPLDLTILTSGLPDSSIRDTAFRNNRSIVLIQSDDPEFGNTTPYVSTRLSGSRVWSALAQVDREVEIANAYRDDGWGNNARGVMIGAGGRFHAFFDQFATHPEPRNLTNDLDPTNNNYDDPFPQYNDSYDLFHAWSDR